MRDRDHYVTDKQSRVIAEMKAWRDGESDKTVLKPMKKKRSLAISRAMLDELNKDDNGFSLDSE